MAYLIETISHAAKKKKTKQTDQFNSVHFFYKNELHEN